MRRGMASDMGRGEGDWEEGWQVKWEEGTGSGKRSGGTHEKEEQEEKWEGAKNDQRDGAGMGGKRGDGPQACEEKMTRR